MDSVVAVSHRGGNGKGEVAHAHMLQQRNNENNDLMRGGSNGHMVDDHRNGNVMAPGKQASSVQSDCSVG